LVIRDIDHFKTINDTLGRQAGDRLLSDLSERVASHIRAVDMLFRWGGEEFILLAPSTGYTAATPVAERIRKDIAGSHCPDIGQITVSAAVAE
jgi:diguanylate cyclase (GGDEF)-like protein